MPTFADKARFADVRALKSSPAALLCEIDGEQIWIPQSQIDDESSVWKEGDEGELVVSQWLAEKKGIV